MIGNADNEAGVESVQQTGTDNFLHRVDRDAASNITPKAVLTSLMKPFSHGWNHMKPLDKFVSAAKTAKCEVESVVSQHTPGYALEKHENSVVGKWSAVMKDCFKLAHEEFRSRLSGGDMDKLMTTAVSEATVFTVSLMTMYESRNFKPTWIMEAIVILHATQEIAAKSVFSQTLQPLLQSRNELLRYCDERFPDCFDEVNTCVRGVERAISE